MTFDRSGCSSCVNNVIDGRICVNRRKHVTWVTTGIRGHFEIIYTRPTADTGSLAGVSLKSRVLGRDTFNHGDWPPSARRGISSQWPLAGKQKKQRSKAMKITQCDMVKRRRNYWLIWQSVFVSLRLPVSHTYASYDPFGEIKCECYIFIKKYHASSFIFITVSHSSLS